MSTSTRATQAPQTIGRLLRRELSHALLDILIAGLIGIIIGGVVTEVAIWSVSGVIPTPAGHIAAALVAVLLGYALALTVAFRALLRGIMHSAEWAAREVEKLASGGAHEIDEALHHTQYAPVTTPLVVNAQTTASRSAAHANMNMIGGIVDEF